MKKIDLQNMVGALATENTVLLCALNDVLRSKVSWFGRLGVTRPDCASGGIVIVNNSGTISAHYLEEYARDQLAHISLCLTGEDNDYNNNLLARREEIVLALNYARGEQIKQ